MKTVNDYLNELVEAKALTESGKLLILKQLEIEKLQAIYEHINKNT